MKRINFKKIAIIALCVILSAGVIFGAVKIFGAETKDVPFTRFSVGGLDENGVHMNSKTTFYTKEGVECLGLKIVPDFENTSTYQIYWYNEDDVFIGKTAELTDKYLMETPELARYARIMIIPSGLDEDGNKIEDFKVTVFDVFKYLKHFTITVNKDQTYEADNLYEAAKEKSSEKTDGITVSSDVEFISGAMIKTGASSFAFDVTNSNAERYNVIKVNCSDVEKFILKVEEYISDLNYTVCFYSASGNKLSTSTLSKTTDTNIIDVPASATYMCINIPTYVDGTECPVVLNRYVLK